MHIKLTVRALLYGSALGVVAALTAGCSSGMAPSVSQSGGNPAAVGAIQSTVYVQQQIATGNFIPACPTLVFHEARCLAIGLKDLSRAPHFATQPPGFGPSQLQAAYNTTDDAKNNKGGLVVVVEAGGDPHLESDLAVYRKTFGLPACIRATGCLKIVNQDGHLHPLPPVIDGWLAEQSLDVDMVSANCPNCKIMVVQAHTSLGIAEITAARANPVAISNSWGGEEFPGEKPSEHRLFDHPGIAITASSGDGGYGVIFPSAANTVTAVGGTSLYVDSGSKRGYRETVWNGTGSGCSEYIPETKWQEPIEEKNGGCTKRITSDVAYIADPNTGVSVYESIPGDGENPGWQVWGGTSVGSPAIAAIYALSGDTKGIPASISYAETSHLYNITEGSNGSCSPYDYLCTGEEGYNGPTGNGTPNGTKAF
jgi:subtilase family serine protease